MMTSGRIVVLLVATLLTFGSVAAGQSIVSARAGAIHHVEGTALMDGQPIVMEFAKFPNLKENSTLETELGRVEMLLNPGTIMRLAENSAVKMVSNRLTDTRLDMLRGSAIVEVIEVIDENAVTLKLNDATISLKKAGLYRLDADPPELRVYKGKAEVVKDDEVLIAKHGRVVELSPYLVAAKFDAKNTDSLYRWSSRRSGYLAMANLSAARSLNSYGSGWFSSGWLWNPYMGMMTYVPLRGVFYSPFGYSFFSPSYVYMVYNPPQRAQSAWGGGGGSGFSARHGYVVTSSRGASSAGRTTYSPSSSGGSAATAATGGSSRGGGGAIGRGSAGGGRGR